VCANAKELVDEANLLFSHGAFARCYALAHLACEELAKLPMIFRAGMELRRGRDVDWVKLWKRMRDHSEKLDMIALFDYCFFDEITIDNSDVERYEARKRALPKWNAAKNSSLYAGAYSNGLVKPSELFSEAEVKVFLDYAHLTLERFQQFEAHSEEVLSNLRPDSTVYRMMDLLGTKRF
jgi:AbiV family abortive infection protein